MKIWAFSYPILLIFAISTYIGFRPEGVDYDYAAYQAWFEYVASLSNVDFSDNLFKSSFYFHTEQPYSFEIGFALLTYVLSFVSPFPELQFVYICFIGLYIKYLSLKKYDINIFYSSLLYFSWSLMLLEMTQLRACIAAGILIYSARYIAADKVWRGSLGVLGASAFHVSAFVALPLVFLAKFELNNFRLVLLLGSVWFLTNVIGLTGVVEYFTFIPKISEYRGLLIDKEMYSEINIWNIVYVVRWLTFLYVYYLYRTFPLAFNKYEVVALKMFLYSLLIYYALAEFPVVGGRLSELLAVFQIVCYPVILKCEKRKYLAIFVIIAVALMQFYALVFYSRLVDFFYIFGDIYNLSPIGTD